MPGRADMKKGILASITVYLILNGFLFTGCAKTGNSLLAPVSPSLSAPTAVPSAPTAYVYFSQWGTAGSGNGQFNGVWGMAADASGNLYVDDGLNDRIQKFTTAGVY